MLIHTLITDIESNHVLDCLENRCNHLSRSLQDAFVVGKQDNVRLDILEVILQLFKSVRHLFPNVRGILRSLTNAHSQPLHP